MRTGVRGIAAEGTVAAPSREVFDFLARLENHWQLADRWIEVASLESDGDGARANGGAVAVRGPLGLSRTVRTRVLAAEPPRRLRGRAEVGGRTRASITWSLADAGEATRVRLEAEVERIGAVDRVLWALGGRRWMLRRFEAVIAGLRGRFSQTRPASADSSLESTR